MMRKAIFALCVGLSLASCAKEQTIPTTHTRVLSYAMTGNSMYTKAVGSTDVLSAISNHLPASMQVVLEGKKTFVANTGEPIELPSDTYTLTGTHLATPFGRQCSTDGGALSQEASIKVTQKTLTITDEETNYTLESAYHCFALVCDATLVQSATATDAYGKTFNIDFVREGDVLLVFASGGFKDQPVTITLTPVDATTYKETAYCISTKNTAGLGYAEHGKWYYLAPTMNGNQPKLIAYDLPAMTQGEL